MGKIIRRVDRFLMRVEGRLAQLQGRGWGSNTIDAEVSACLQLLGRPPEIFVDAGANKGIYTKELLRRVSNIRCFLFEPSSENVAILLETFKGDKRVTIVHSALSDKASEATLYADVGGSGTGSLTKRRLDHLNVHFNHEQRVQTQRLDTFWSAAGQGPTIDYIKMDVEGAELQVLKGLGGLIKNTSLIQFEFGGCNIDTRTFFQDFWYYFAENDFDLFIITPFGPRLIEHYSESLECFRTTNYIARNRAYAVQAKLLNPSVPSSL